LIREYTITFWQHSIRNSAQNKTQGQRKKNEIQHSVTVSVMTH